MEEGNTGEGCSSLSILDKDYISKIKKGFEDIIGDDEIQSTTLEYLESFKGYFLKYPNK